MVEERMARFLSDTGPGAGLYGMMRYHLGWVDESFLPVQADGGKRVRARLCLLACQAAGGLPEQAISPAAAVELVHNFSLIHDDIQDRSAYRRHRPTVWSVWGAPQAINAGDGMFTAAQLALAEAEGTDPATRVQGFQTLNHACRMLCEGQYLDLDFERRVRVSVDDYLAMIERKTASLLATACYLGALYAGADAETRSRYREFGLQMGMAFQMQDDHLGNWGDPKVTGKPAADDVVNKKKTLPLVYSLEAATPPDRKTLLDILSRPGLASPEETSLVLDIMARCGAPEHTAREVARLSDLALAALQEASPHDPAGAEMAALVRRLVVRAS